MEPQKNDPLGQACLDFLSHQNKDTEIIVEAVGFENDIIPVPYLFRTYEIMPELEQLALEMTNGNVLDVGAGTGCHSNYLISKKGLKVKAVETSKGAVEILKKQNISVEFTDVLNLKTDEKFDTILLLMNGLGLAQTKVELPRFLSHLTSMLTDGGKIICDSSDLSYLYEGLNEDEFDQDEFDEIVYRMSYLDHQTDWFHWLYIKFEDLKEICLSLNLKAEKVFESDSNEYLTVITRK